MKTGKTIPGFPRYTITTTGRVWSHINAPKQLKANYPKGSRVAYFSLRHDGQTHTVSEKYLLKLTYGRSAKQKVVKPVKDFVFTMSDVEWMTKHLDDGIRKLQLQRDIAITASIATLIGSILYIVLN